MCWVVARLLSPRDSPGKNTGVGCHLLLQGIFPTQGSNPWSPSSPALAGVFFATEPAGKPTLVNKSRKWENWTSQGKSTGCQSQAFVKMENSLSVVCVGYVLFVSSFFFIFRFFLLSSLLYVFIIKLKPRNIRFVRF